MQVLLNLEVFSKEKVLKLEIKSEVLTDS